jgi:xanthine dehydrogenase accessory factor
LQDMLTILKKANTECKDSCLITITNSSNADFIGSKAVYLEGGDFFPEKKFPISLKNSLFEKCFALLKKGKSMATDIKVEGVNFECFIDIYPSPPHLIIAGAGHVGETVAKLGDMLGFYITVIDDRPEFANTEKFPDVDEVVCESFLSYFKNVPLTSKTYILLLTRGHRFDVLSLQELLGRIEQPFYIGMIGSRRRISGVFEQLKEEFPVERLSQIYTPVGLDIGAETPEEIAVSIMAEILKVKNGRTGESNCNGIRPLAARGFRELERK